MTVSELLTKLSEVREQQAPLKEALSVLESDEATLRKELEVALASEGLKTAKNEKLMAIVATRKDYRVADEVLVRGYLQNHNIEQDYLKLDVTAVKKLAKTDVIPGLEATEQTVLTLRNAKEEVEQVVDTESPAEFRARVEASRLTGKP